MMNRSTLRLSGLAVILSMAWIGTGSTAPDRSSPTLEARQHATEALAPGHGFRLTVGAIDLLAELQRPSHDRAEVGSASPLIPTEILGRLDNLRDVHFPNEVLFRKAVEVEVGVGPALPDILAAIIEAAREPATERRDAAPRPHPINWTGKSGCGPPVPGDGSVNLYGMVPYWVQPQDTGAGDDQGVEARAVDFSVLTRVGYYALTFGPDGSVRDPLHWRQGAFPEGAPFWQRSDYSDFVATAHRHATAVDLVVANSDWADWLIPEGGAPADTAVVRERNLTARERLRADLTDLITRPLPGPIERMKPILSFGQSPRRTLGDGVTLDLDFRDMAADDQHWLFDEFRGFLADYRAKLDALNAPGIVMDLGGDYRLNLMVPWYCLVEGEHSGAEGGCAFYSWENLVTIEPYVDLILIDLGDLALPMAASTSPLRVAMNLRAEMDRTLGIPDQVHLSRKLVPLVPTGRSGVAQMAQFARYADLAFPGLGMWSVPVDDSVANVVRAAFFPATPPTTGSILWQRPSALGSLLDLGERACTVTCPHRWEVRAAGALVLVMLLVLWIASSRFAPLAGLYQAWTFPAMLLLVEILLVASVWCDPYWRARRAAILLVSLGVSLVLARSAVRRKRKKVGHP